MLANKSVKQKILLAACILAMFILCAAGFGVERSYDTTDDMLRPEEACPDTDFFEYTWLDESSAIPDDAVYIDLNETEGSLPINAEGDYVLEGKLNGNITVDAPDSNVRLILNGAVIKSDKGPAIKCVKADKLVITLNDGTENTVSDGLPYDHEDESDAAVYSNAPVTVNGKGSIGIDGLFKDAIHSKDVIKIVEGTVSVKAVRYGLNGNDGVAVRDGNLSISGKKNGIRTLTKGAGGKGSIFIEGGSISIISGKAGLKTEKGNLCVTGGSVFVNGVLGTSDIAGVSYIKEGCVNE